MNKKPTIYEKDINGMGSGGYLSVRADSVSRHVLEKMVNDHKATRDLGAEKQFKNSYCVRFPSHFTDYVTSIDMENTDAN